MSYGRSTILGNAVRFELSIDELECVEVAALEGSKEGTRLHVVMEQTYPTSEYVSAFFLSRGHEVSFAKPNQVKEFRKCLSDIRSRLGGHLHDDDPPAQDDCKAYRPWPGRKHRH